ncbi:MAG: phosphomannomutase/phosphoglucomutase [Candidatus Firestonebacteria bacterium]|nr:phosphomannomutase/phosphoglucomutase [Candidatus Firestonebacteria bacterium]
MNEEIFREYDIRGVVDTDLTFDVVKKLGQGIASYIKNHNANQIVISRDNRESSLRFRNALTEGINSCGCDVIDIGLLPTPLFYFSMFQLKKDGGIMITGSHNPPNFNGFKIFENGSTIYGDEIQKVKKIILNNKFPEGNGKIIPENTILDKYIEYVSKNITLSKPIKVVVDCGNGTAGLVAPILLNKIGAEVVELYCELDGRFPNHHPDPTIPAYLKDLQTKVKETNADVGIAYDGDADRIGAIDNKGNILWGDRLLGLFSRDVLQKGHAKIVLEVKCSQALVEYITKYGGTPIMWKAGHSLIKGKMKEEKASLGGEMSGHMFFRDRYFGYDDAIYASARLVEILSNSNLKLSEILSDMPLYNSTPEIRIGCPDKDKFWVIEEVKKYFSKKYKVIDIDGARVLFNDGWGLVRASNTQPVIVMRCEGKTEKALLEIKEIIKSKLKEYSIVEIPKDL